MIVGDFMFKASWRGGWSGALVVILLSLAPAMGAARSMNILNKSSRQKHITAMPNYSSLVVNADTGKIIHQVKAREPRHPASLTKMMTLYLIFNSINHGHLTMDQELPVSPLASRQKPSKLQLEAGETITVREVIYALIVKSANDAAMVAAEAIGGSSGKFAAMMNSKAKQLGMKETTFVNAHGWHHPDQVTTAYDMALLSIALRRDHKKFYHLFSTKSFMFRGQEIVTHNKVMLNYPWADGLKTGYINASGFNLVTSAKKANHRLVAVVMGGPSAKARDMHMISLLERAYGKMLQVAQVSNKKNHGIFAPLHRVRATSIMQ